MAAKWLMYFLVVLISIQKGMLLGTSTTFHYQGNLFGLSKYELFCEITSNLLSCARQCSNIDTCRAISYNEEQTYCITYNSSESHDLINSSDWMFYKRLGDTFPTDPNCPKGWTKGAYKCYWLSPDDDMRSHSDAITQCELMNAKVLTIQSETEQKEVEKLIMNTKDKNEKKVFVWTGGKVNLDSNVPKVSWIDLSTNPSIDLQMFTNWGQGHPVPYFKCIAMVAYKETTGHFGDWQNKDCNQMMHYICEMPINLIK